MIDFEGFKWYDWIAIYFFASMFQIFIFATFLGGGFITAIILAITWEGWKFYERWRSGYYDT